MDIFQEIVKLRAAGRRGALATITSVRGSIPSFQTSTMLVRDDGSILGTIGGGCVGTEGWQGAGGGKGVRAPRRTTGKLLLIP